MRIEREDDMFGKDKKKKKKEGGGKGALIRTNVSAVEPSHQEPPVEHQEPPVSERGNDKADPRFFWPKGKKMPEYYVRRRPLPCPKCRRVRTYDLAQVALCTHSGKDTAWFRCRACGHRWEMPVKSV